MSGTSGADVAPRPCLGVRILAHPDPARAGEWALLFDADATGTARVSRSAPDFRTPAGERTGPLGSNRISRRPLEVTRHATGIELRPDPDVEVWVNGTVLDEVRTFSNRQCEEGLVVLFGRYLAFWIGWLEPLEPPQPVAGLVGESRAMWQLRRHVHRVAAMDVPVLLRGATGVGKELVAAAIHARSARAGAPYVPVNIAGIPPSMAASELFGHCRGAFTGAVDTRKGYFVQADGGTLFLDEIGDIGTDVQALLLRAVQHGVIQPLGGATRPVNVRLIAATDSDLESAIVRREFRAPLLHRFSFALNVPSLRARRDDVGVLFCHFLRERLHALGDGRHFGPASDGAEPWIPASYVADLALYDWPGNVRELSNVALHFVVANRDRERGRITDELRQLARPQERPSSAPSIPVAKDASAVTDEDILEALRQEGFSRPRAARRLNLSKSYLYRRLESQTLAPLATELSAEQIRTTLETCGGDYLAASQCLQVSVRALRLQMTRMRKGGS